MSGIRGKDTKPELVLRKGLHAMGYRYKLNDPKLPGKPDLVFPRFGAVILINGCFWHGHDCHLFKWPRTRPGFWRTKIDGNRRRDQIVHEQLIAKGWRVLRVWECALKGKYRLGLDSILEESALWLESNTKERDIRGHE